MGFSPVSLLVGTRSIVAFNSMIFLGSLFINKRERERERRYSRLMPADHTCKKLNSSDGIIGCLLSLRLELLYKILTLKCSLELQSQIGWEWQLMKAFVFLSLHPPYANEEGLAVFDCRSGS